jgi:esterase
MKTMRADNYDMAYVELGTGSPIVCVHGSMGDYRSWSPVLGPLSRANTLITPSLRHCFPEHWDGQGPNFTIAQHISDMIAFLEGLKLGPVDLIGHSRGGHIAFRLAQQRPDLLRKLVLAEPGGTMDATAEPVATRPHVALASEKIANGDIEGGLQVFKDAIDGKGSWQGLAEADRQYRRDNAMTLLAQVNEGRQPYSKADAESISTPTLFVGGTDTPGLLPKILAALSANVEGAEVLRIPNASHSMFVQQPKAFCEGVLEFLERKS